MRCRGVGLLPEASTGIAGTEADVYFRESGISPAASGLRIGVRRHPVEGKIPGSYMAPRHILALCYAASGAAALVYQVAWVRLFTLTLGHTVAASSTVLAAFMGGLAVGAWAAGRLAANSRSL